MQKKGENKMANGIKILKTMTQDFMASNGEHYFIVKVRIPDYKSDGTRICYGIINHKDVEESGKLKRQIGGGEMVLSDTVAELIDRVEKGIKVDELEAQGMDRMAAVLMVMNGMKKDEAEMWAKRINGAA